MENKYSSTIWPILYFETDDWPPNIPVFELGVQLIKADEKTLNDIAGIDRDGYGGNPEGLDNVRKNTHWFLSMPRLQVDERIPVKEKGVSFSDSLQRTIVDSFLFCLQLVRSTKAICAFEFPAIINNDSIVDVDTTGDPYGEKSEEPDVYLPETFKIGDLQLLTDLWSVLIKFSKLDIANTLVSDAKFFRDCDIKAGEDATKKIVDLLMTNPTFLEIPEKDRKLFASSLRETELWQEYYKECFQKVFLEKQEEIFSNRTRLGRALNLFFKGIQLPLLHSFLSICLALETLYTVEETEITYQFATRLANLTGKDKTFEQRKDIFERARNVYKGRSDIVHGRKSIDTIKDSEPNILDDAFLFARQSLQHILLDSKLLDLYSDPRTSDNKAPHKAVKAIKEYFRDLDLR